MGSPITSWEGAGAIFTGAGGSTPGLILALAVIACIGAIVFGARHESHAYKSLE